MSEAADLQPISKGLYIHSATSSAISAYAGKCSKCLG